MLTADPLIPSGLWVTLAIAGVVVLAVYAWRRPRGAARGRWAAIVGLMGASLAMVMGLLLNPTWARPVPPPPGLPLLTVLVDRSASMATPDGAAAGQSGRTRFEAAVALAKQLEGAGGGADAHRDVDVRVRWFDEKVEAANLAEGVKGKPMGEVTDIAGAILASVESDRPQGQAVVLLTDGIQTADGAPGGGAEGGIGAVRAAARYAKAAGAPVYGVVLGGEGGGVDLSVEAHAARELAFAGQKVTLVADVRSRGYTGKGTVRLMSEGKEIATREVDLAAEQVTGVRFEAVQEKPGLYPYEMKVEAKGLNELTEANNSALCMLRVVDKAVRVMLVEGKPYWDSKFLTRQLAGDVSVEMHSLVQMGPDRVIQRVVSRAGAAGAVPGSATMPAGAADDQWRVMHEPGKVLADPAALDDFQIVVLGRDVGDFLSAEAVANIQRWISRQGGALLCYRGSPEAQVEPGLARLLPVKWEPAREARYQLKLTDMGKSLDWFGAAAGGGNAGFLMELPPLSTDTQVEQTKPLAVVVAEAEWQGRPETPAVAYQPYGAGRVVVLEGAGMWRWAFPPATAGAAGAVGASAAAGTDEAYGAVWHALFRWIISGAGLVPGEQAAIRPDKISFQAREQAAATVLVAAEQQGQRQAGGTGGAGAATTAPAAGLKVELKGPGEAREFECLPSADDPGAYRVQFGVLPAGRYRAELKGGAGAEAVFDVREIGEEQLALTARPDVMRLIAEESGGAVVMPGEIGSVAGRMKEQLARARPERVTFVTAWDRAWVFVAVMALWAMAWGLRRASGLV